MKGGGTVDHSNRLEELVTRYENTLFRTALAILGDVPEAEDAVQDAFVRYLEKRPAFRDAGHERAWLLKVTANGCKSRLRARRRHPWVRCWHCRLNSGRQSTSIITRDTPPTRLPPFWASGPGRCAATSAGPDRR